MANQRPRPDTFAIIIGAMKSGTTSLFELLAQHPEIAPSREKEPNYFSDAQVMNRGWDWYCGLWDWDPGRHRIALEASTSYTMAPHVPGVPARIAAASAGRFRFIYMLRDPLARIVSQMRHGRYAGWYSPAERITDHMLNICRYAMQLDRYLAHFPQESLHLVVLEEFARTPAVVLREVCRFLGVGEDFEFPGAGVRHNTGEIYDVSSFWARVITAKPVKFLSNRMLPRRLRRRLREQVGELLGRRRQGARDEGTSNGLTSEDRADILRQLAPDLHRLKATYGIDIQRYWSLDVDAVGRTGVGSSYSWTTLHSPSR